MEIRTLSYEHIDALVKLHDDNLIEWNQFTPHEFDRYSISSIISRTKLDLYYVIIYKGDIIGYGMLRGMDEGYKNFSLGIGIDKKYYGTGLSTVFMLFLELQAKIRGHLNIRLRVMNDNKRAYNLYLKLGYTFTKFDEQSIVGVKRLC